MKWHQKSSERISIPSELKPELARMRGKVDEIRIEITPVYPLRTLKMNALFHANLKRICKVTGADFDMVKDQIKKEAMAIGYPYQREEDGSPKVINGELVPKSSADVCVSEFSLLFYALDNWMQENGVDMEIIWE